MRQRLTDVRSVVAELGGAKAVSDMFGVTENAVWNWTGSDRFPAHTYFDIRDRLKLKRKSAPEELWKRPVPKADDKLSEVASAHQ